MDHSQLSGFCAFLFLFLFFYFFKFWGGGEGRGKGCWAAQVSLDRSNTHSKFNLIKVRTHDLQIIDSTFLAPEILSVRPPPMGL